MTLFSGSLGWYLQIIRLQENHVQVVNKWDTTYYFMDVILHQLNQAQKLLTSMRSHVQKSYQNAFEFIQ